MNLDTDHIRSLIQDYSEAETRREQREIENAIMEATIWNGSTGRNRSTHEIPTVASFTEEEIQVLRDTVDKDAQRAQMLLRRHEFAYLDSDSEAGPGGRSEE